MKDFWFTFARWLCLITCKLVFRYRAEGLENIPKDGAFLLLSNHQSYFDPIFSGMFITRHLRFLARDSLFKNPFFGRILRSVNAIPVRRGEADIAAMKQVIKELKSGHGVCLYPEATRTTDGKIKAFKPGFGLLCKRGKAGIVPMVIDGAYEAWPRHRKLPGFRKLVTVRYGKMITAEEATAMNERELADRLTATIRKMQADVRKENERPLLAYPSDSL